MYASSAGQLSLVETLVEAGATVNAQADRGWTALSRAALKGHTAIVEALLGVGACPEVPDAGNGLTAVQHAAAQDHTAIVKALSGSHAAPAAAVEPLAEPGGSTAAPVAATCVPDVGR